MLNVLFDRDSKVAVGLNRPALPFEIEVKNIDPTGLTKIISYDEEIDGKDEEGNQLYIIPQLPLEEVIENEVQVETTEDTGTPVMVQVQNKVPLLNDNGEQVQYEIMESVVVSPAVYDEETGELIEEEVTKQVGTGHFIKCFTVETDEIQKTDENGNKLYYGTDINIEEVSIPQPDLYITEEDERYSECLEKLKQSAKKEKTVSFTESSDQFTYEDVVNHKEKQITNGTFFGNGILFEKMDETLFSTNLSSFNADIGFDFISLPSGREIRTVKLSLPMDTDLIGIKLETSWDGINVYIGESASKLIKLENNEVAFEESISEVYVKFENPTDKRIDIYSFALLV